MATQNPSLGHAGIIVCSAVAPYMTTNLTNKTYMQLLWAYVLLIKAYSICDASAKRFGAHSDLLKHNFKVLAGLIQCDAPASDYLDPIDVVEKAQAWYDAHAPRAKRLCAAAKRGEPVQKKSKLPGAS